MHVKIHGITEIQNSEFIAYIPNYIVLPHDIDNFALTGSENGTFVKVYNYGIRKFQVISGDTPQEAFNNFQLLIKTKEDWDFE